MDWQNMQVIEKANFVVSNLTSGGKLVAAQAQEFLKVAIKNSKLLPMVTTETMTSPQKEIPNIRFAGRVLTGGKPSTPVALADRAVPTLGKVTLSTNLFKGQCRIEDEVFEDNIEHEALKQTVLEQLGLAVSRDMEDVVINGDTTSSDNLYKQMDGILKQVTSNVVAAGGVKLTKGPLRDLLKTLPIEFRRDKGKLRYMTSMDAEIDYRDSLSDRQTSLGDQALTQGITPVASGGIEVVDIPLWPQISSLTSVLLGDPKNITLGIQREVKIEPWRDPDAGQVVFNISLRMDVKLAYEPAMAKMTGIAVA